MRRLLASRLDRHPRDLSLCSARRVRPHTVQPMAILRQGRPPQWPIGTVEAYPNPIFADDSGRRRPNTIAMSSQDESKGLLPSPMLTSKDAGDLPDPATHSPPHPSTKVPVFEHFGPTG
jgi:hypothetical protein